MCRVGRALKSSARSHLDDGVQLGTFHAVVGRVPGLALAARRDTYLPLLPMGVDFVRLVAFHHLNPSPQICG